MPPACALPGLLFVAPLDAYLARHKIDLEHAVRACVLERDSARGQLAEIEGAIAEQSDALPWWAWGLVGAAVGVAVGVGVSR